MIKKETDKLLFQHVLDDEYLYFDSRLESNVADLLEDNHLTIAVSESLTGGLVGYRLALRPGASQYFIGGILCYSTSVKCRLCHVKPETIRKNVDRIDNLFKSRFISFSHSLIISILDLVSGCLGTKKPQQSS